MAIIYKHKSIEKKSKTYKVGDTFILNGNNKNTPFILAQVGYGEVAIISLLNGNRLSTPVKVNNLFDIDLNEVIDTTLNDLTPCDFILTAKED